MNSGRVYLDSIRDMLENAEKAIEFVGDMSFQQFSEDEKTTYLVAHLNSILDDLGDTSI